VEDVEDVEEEKQVGGLLRAPAVKKHKQNKKKDHAFFSPSLLQAFLFEVFFVFFQVKIYSFQVN